MVAQASGAVKGDPSTIAPRLSPRPPRSPRSPPEIRLRGGRTATGVESGFKSSLRMAPELESRFDFPAAPPRLDTAPAAAAALVTRPRRPLPPVAAPRRPGFRPATARQRPGRRTASARHRPGSHAARGPKDPAERAAGRASLPLCVYAMFQMWPWATGSLTWSGMTGNDSGAGPPPCPERVEAGPRKASAEDALFYFSRKFETSADPARRRTGPRARPGRGGVRGGDGTITPAERYIFVGTRALCRSHARSPTAKQRSPNLGVPAGAHLFWRNS